MIVLEVPRRLWRSVRVAAFESFAEWLDTHHAATLGLPRDAEVVVEVHGGAELPRRHYRSAVGLTLLVDPATKRPRDDYRVAIATGAYPGEDDASWQARLETLPHELAHVGSWYAIAGATPARAGHAAWAAWKRRAPETVDDPEEQLGRRLTAQFIAASRGARR